MKKWTLLITLLFLTSINLNGQNVPNPASYQVEILIGNWIIDLRPTPESDGYFQEFNIVSVDDNLFKGTFYGSEIEKPILNKNWDKLYFAFTTRDQSNEYYHSGYFEGGKLFGITYCPNRNFAAPWTGEKK